MKVVVTSLYYENYTELAKITVYRNLAWYAFRLGYAFVPYFVQDAVDPDPYKMACKACVKNTELILKTLNDYPDAEWVFHRDCDSIITNMNRKIEDIYLEYTYDILTGSDKAGVSAGQMIVRNTERARAYLAEFLENQKSYEHEQDYMAKNPRSFLYMTPQNVMNSYDSESRLEPADTPGNWKQGDFLVHLAGLNLTQKMAVVEKWMGKVEFNG